MYGDGMSVLSRPSVRDEQKSLTRARVLDAAVRVFTDKSVVGATMTDIATAAGVTRVTVYAHFGGKQEIIQALVARAYELGTTAYTELAAQPEWTRAGIRAWLDGLVVRWRELGPTVRVLVSAGSMAAVPAEGNRSRFMTAHEHWVDLLAAPHHQRWRGVPAEEARQRALMATLQIESLLTTWLAGDWPLRTEDPVALLADSVCHLLGPALSAQH